MGSFDVLPDATEILHKHLESRKSLWIMGCLPDISWRLVAPISLFSQTSLHSKEATLIVPWKPTSELQNTWSVRLDAFIVFFDSGHSFFDTTTFLSFFCMSFLGGLFSKPIYFTPSLQVKKTPKNFMQWREFFSSTFAPPKRQPLPSTTEDRAAFLHLWHPRVSWPKHRSFQPPETSIGSPSCLVLARWGEASLNVSS